jgi:formylglycine-generating enzyme required for sulfatase activity
MMVDMMLGLEFWYRTAPPSICLRYLSALVKSLFIIIPIILSPKASGAVELDTMIEIPGGTFVMGANDGMEGSAPAHEVRIDSFTIDSHEVTNVRFAEFLNYIGKTALSGKKLIDLPLSGIEVVEAGGKALYRPKEGMEEYPVVSVTWHGANEYAKFRGKRLPTEAEWEYAAAGGLKSKFPWGDEFDPNRENQGGSFGALTPVMSYLPNGFGIYDMAGNAMEWVADWYREEYYKSSPAENPKGPSVGTERIVRGGAFDSILPVTVRDRFHLKPDRSLPDLGFRCVK